jgi:hypothetical protein
VEKLDHIGPLVFGLVGEFNTKIAERGSCYLVSVLSVNETLFQSQAAFIEVTLSALRAGEKDRATAGMFAHSRRRLSTEPAS